MDDAFVCIIDRDRFAGYLMEHPDLALRITRVIAERKQAVEQRVLDLMSKDVRTRLAHALARLADRYGQQDEDGLRIDLRLTQTDLGQLVGSTRETTSMVRRFQRPGVRLGRALAPLRPDGCGVLGFRLDARRTSSERLRRRAPATRSL